MTPLFFSASIPSSIASAISTQTHESLRPYTAYLKSAITAAQSRESRSVCRWELVPEECRIQVEPLDTVIELQTEGFAYKVEGWAGAPPSMPMFIGTQFRPLQPIRIASDVEPVVVWLNEEIPSGERAFWSGSPCHLKPCPPSWPQRLIARHLDGSILPIRKRQESATRLLLVIEGKEPFTLLSEKGEQLAYKQVDAAEGQPSYGERKWKLPGQGNVSSPSLAPQIQRA